MFSHENLSEDTQDLLNRMLAEDAEAGAEDEKEVEACNSPGGSGAGSAPCPVPGGPGGGPCPGLAPPPGPPPPQPMPPPQPCLNNTQKKIPSLFEIRVQPTGQLAQKLGVRVSNDTETRFTFVSQMLAEDAEAGAEDEKEVEELKKQGINPLPKPPPGVGLLPTPPRPPPSDPSSPGGGPCDSPGGHMGPGPPPGPPGMRPPGPMPHDMSMGPPGMNQGPPPMGPGPPMMPFGPGDGPPQGMMPPGPPPPYFENFENFYHPQQGMEMERGGEQAEDAEAGAEDEKEVEELKKQGINPLPKPPPGVGLLPTPPRPPPSDPSSPGGGPCDSPGEDDYGDYEEMEQGDGSMGFMDQPPPDQGSMMGLDPGAGQGPNQPGIPDFLPTAQLALFMRIQQKQQQAEERARRLAEGGGERDAEGDTANWYSSEEEDGGGSVTSILKTLRQQTQGGKLPNQPPPPHPTDTSPGGLNNPRLGTTNPAAAATTTAAATSRPADPRLSRDPRLTRTGETSQSDPPADPRLARHAPPPKPDPAPHHRARSGPADEEEGERVLRDKPVPIPSEPVLGQALKDPRSQLQQFSHIKKDIVLLKPSCKAQRGDTANWYSSEEEDGGGSVTSILKPLRQQTQAGKLPNQPPPPHPTDTSPGGLNTPRPATTNPAAATTAAATSRLADPRLAPSGPADEEEGERVLRDKPVPIPSEPVLGQALKDPRSQLQQFSHIKKDIVLLKPSFSKSVLWSPEDLIPLPVPKQDFLPLPPGIPPVTAVDPRLNRAQQQREQMAPPVPPLPPPPSIPPAQPEPAALPDFELLSRILKTVNAASGQVPLPQVQPPPSAPADKPVDPRMARKHPADPRFQNQKPAVKALSAGPAATAVTAAAAAASPPVIAQPTQPAASAIAPYDPRLLSAGGGGRGGGGVGLGSANTGQSSVLSSISLYDPRTQSTGSGGGGGGGGGGGVGSGASAAKSESGNTANGNSSSDPKAGEAGKPAKLKEPLFVRKSALDQPETEKTAGSEPATDRYNSYNRPRPKPAAPPPSATLAAGITGDGSAVTGVSNPESGQQPGVHNLPVSSVFGLKQAAKSGGTGSPFGGSSPAQPTDSAEQDAASLKEVFKGFDPTASPFCQ
ncbi:UNVERIFIED_CONTAM: hypothetical protein FKN15_009943 [Acipenser sinensis]